MQRQVVCSVLGIALCLLGSVATADDRQEDERTWRERWRQQTQPSSSLYAAIAYSPATGKYGYSYRWSSRAAAEREAIRQCRASDAWVVVWAVDGYCTLAEAEDRSAYGWGYGASRAQAEAIALAACRKRTAARCAVIAWVYSGSQ